MSTFTPGPWQSKHDYTKEGACTIIANIDGDTDPSGSTIYSYDFICTCADEFGEYTERAETNARLIAAAPDHVLICWAMCVQDARWEEWVPFDGKGEFCFAGLKYATSLDEFGCPVLTPALRQAIAQAQSVPA